MPANVSLLYGFEWDRDYLIDFSMTYQRYMPFIALLLHPFMQYLLLFETKSMRTEIRVFYALTHLALVLNEWTFCFAFRIYPVIPYAALYCEGPICKGGFNKQILMAILSIPVIMITAPFVTLMMRMHQMLLPVNSKLKLSMRTQLWLAISLNVVLIVNVVGSGYFGKDYDDYDQLVQKPEIAWIIDRGGSIFLFGPPSDPQYFKSELLVLLLSIMIVSPFLIFFTADSMKNIAKSSSLSNYLSGNTRAMALRMYQVFLVQCLGAVICYIVPLFFMLTFMVIDPSFMPDWFLGPARLFILTLFTVNGHQFCIFFILKTPAHRKIIVRLFRRLICSTPPPKVTVSNAEQRSLTAIPNMLNHSTRKEARF